MSEVVLFHHAQGLTEGVVAFADDLRRAGHAVHVPDLYEGRTFPSLEDGIGYARATGFQAIRDRGLAAAESLPRRVFYAGFSLGVMCAQQLAQTREGAVGAVLMHAAVPLEEFGPWPTGVALQIHTMQEDDLGDVQEARDLAAAVEGSQLYLYPGDRHLFTDRSLDVYDEDAAALVLERMSALLDHG